MCSGEQNQHTAYLADRDIGTFSCSISGVPKATNTPLPADNPDTSHAPNPDVRAPSKKEQEVADSDPYEEVLVGDATLSPKNTGSVKKKREQPAASKKPPKKLRQMEVEEDDSADTSDEHDGTAQRPKRRTTQPTEPVVQPKPRNHVTPAVSALTYDTQRRD